jgi:transposase-like protein
VAGSVVWPSRWCFTLRDNSTNIDPIQEAISDIKSRASGEAFSYRKVAQKWGVNRTTLARRHQGVQADRAGGGQKHQKLSPQQEDELCKYIEGLTKQGLPPTRETVRNFAVSIAKEECSDRWVPGFFSETRPV